MMKPPKRGIVITITQAHRFRRYAVTIAESEIRVSFPSRTASYPISELGSVWAASAAHTFHHGTATENILTGAALGGKDGAFAGALSKTGDETVLTALSLIFCKRMPGQVYFGGPLPLYPEAFREPYRLPANERFVDFTSQVIEAANRAIAARNTPRG